MSGLFSGTPLERPVTCPHCGANVADCPCPRDDRGTLRLPSDQHPRVRREKRHGKWCTVITGLIPVAFNGVHDHASLLRAFRTTLGTGGGMAGNDLVLQGDHRDAVVARLREMGYDARPAGG